MLFAEQFVTMPWPHSYAVFLIALIPAMILAVILHETGHVIAARCVGIRVLAWGVGMRRPWFSFSVDNSIFYFGRPFSSGLTLPAKTTFERESTKELLLILGGPLASILGLSVGLAAWWLGARSNVLTAWIAVSVLIVATSAIPFVMRSKGIQFGSDAYLLLRLLTPSRQHAPLRLGHTLASARALADLMSSVKSQLGRAIYHSQISILESVFGNVPAARESLSIAQHNALSHSEVTGLVAYAQALLAVKENAEDVERVLHTARNLCRDDATAKFWLDCLDEGLRLENGVGNGPRLNELRHEATKAGRTDWLFMVEMLEFEAEPQEDAEAQCRDLLKRQAGQITTFDIARALAITTERLAARGNVSRARDLFAKAQAAITDEASTIASVETRDAYIRAASAPLQRAIALTAEGVPLFIPQPVSEETSQLVAFANATLVSGVVAMISGLIGWSIRRGWIPDGPHNTLIADSSIAIIGVSFLLALLLGIFSIVRRERRWWRLLIGLGLAMLAARLIASIVGLEN